MYLEREYGDKKIPSVEEIQDIVERVLIKTGHAKTAKAYILYREKRARIRKVRQGIKPEFFSEEEKVLKKIRQIQNLQWDVRRSDEKIVDWDRKKVIETLIKETNIQKNIAEIIVTEVEELLISSKIKYLSSSIIRELVNAKLIEYGFENERKKHTRLGIPVYDLENFIFNFKGNPEESSTHLGNYIKKEYALSVILSQEVSDAHLRGDIHIHNLEGIDKLDSISNNPELIKKNAKKGIEEFFTSLFSYSEFISHYFNSGINWDGINVSIAPFISQISDEKLEEILLNFIHQYNSIGNPTRKNFLSFDIYLGIPSHFENVVAIGPGGKIDEGYYIEYFSEAIRFAKVLFKIYLQDYEKTFYFPSLCIHISDKFFEIDDWKEYIRLITLLNLKRENICCCFDGKNRNLETIKGYSLQDITINLPRIAYLSGHKNEKFFQLLSDLLEICFKAHISKENFISKSYLKHLYPVENSMFLIGITGFLESILYHTGSNIRESDESLNFGIEVIKHIKNFCEKYSKEIGKKILLKQNQIKEVSFRFAKLDSQDFKKEVKKVCKDNTEEFSYTNNFPYNLAYPTQIIDFQKEKKFFQLIKGAIAKIYVNEKINMHVLSNIFADILKNNPDIKIKLNIKMKNPK